MKQRDPMRWLAFGGIFLFIVLGCRTTDLIARANPTPTFTLVPTRTTVRPTFTPVPPTLTSSPTLVPTIVPPTRTPTVRPTTRVPTPARTATPAPPPPTPDPYAGWYYRPVNKGCVTAPNTRIEGAVYENGVLKNGVRVRVSHMEGGEPSINDSITGMDPTDYKHVAPEWAGRYRLALYEGQQNAGNWWVFIVDESGNQLSPGVLVTTQDGGGCNTATIDFRH